MLKQQVNLYGEVEESEVCCNFTCKHTESEHNARSHKCQCHTFKASGGKK